MQVPLMPMYPPRVKVYRLNDDGKWDDKGTGHVSVEYLEQRSDAVGLVVIDEEDNATLLVHRISADDIYQRQEDTIISWTDPEVATDLALSFQESMGCAFIWDQICGVQRQIQFPSVSSLDIGARQLGEEIEHSGTSQEDDEQHHGGGGVETVELPGPELSSLPAVAKLVTDISPFHRDRVASLLLRDPSYLRKLLDLFRLSEDLENLEGLHFMYKVVKGLILLNDSAIFEYIFQDDLIMDIVGALEYDPDLPEKQNYRQYLREHVIFKEAVPIRDPAVLSKIHQTYRIGYIKDVILPRALDDQTFGTLNSLMLFNHVEVVTALHNDATFLRDLFTALKQRPDTDRTWQDMMAFLQEFCGLAKHLQPPQRSLLFATLVASGLFVITTRALQSPNETLRLAGTEILMATLSHDPAALRSFLVEQRGSVLLGLLVKGMLTPAEGGLQAQLLEMMRMLLDSETMEATEKSNFLDLFYEDYVEQLVATLVAGCRGGGKGGGGGRSSPVVEGRQVAGRPLPGGAAGVRQAKLPIEEKDITPETLGSICELLCFCVQHHSFRIKYYVLRNNVVEKVLRLTKRKERYLVVAAVRFLRTCVGLKDEFYYRYLVKNALFEPVIAAFATNGERYNLLNSAVIELVDFIRKEGIKSLIVHLWETYGEYLGRISYVDTFQLLRVKYEQIVDGAGGTTPAATVTGPTAAPPTASAAGANRVQKGLLSAEAAAAAKQAELRRKRDGSMDEDEEAYFNSEDDEEASPRSWASAPGGTPTAPTGAETDWQVLLPNGSASMELLVEGGAGLVDYEDEDDDSPTGPAIHHSRSLAGGNAGELLVPSLSYTAVNSLKGEAWPSEGLPRKRSPLLKAEGERRAVVKDADHGSRAAVRATLLAEDRLQEIKRRRMSWNEAGANMGQEGEANHHQRTDSATYPEAQEERPTRRKSGEPGEAGGLGPKESLTELKRTRESDAATQQQPCAKPTDDPGGSGQLFDPGTETCGANADSTGGEVGLETSLETPKSKGDRSQIKGDNGPPPIQPYIV